MISNDNFLKVDSRTVYFTYVTQGSINSYVEKLKIDLMNKSYTATISGDLIKNKQDILETFKQIFRFPDYFGYNWDALEECINDLNWLNSKAYLLILINPDKMQLTEQDFQLLFSILLNSANNWKQGRYYNSNFITHPTPFHLLLIFRQNKNKTNKFIKMLRESGDGNSDFQFIDNIKNTINNEFIIRGKTKYYTAEGALEIISKCEKLNKIISGIEVLLITDKIIQSKDYIDYTAIYYKQYDPVKYLEKYRIQKNSDKGHWTEATHYIKEKEKINPDYFFDIGYEGNY
jgi:RNAse (barnase) inhibitor barstar